MRIEADSVLHFPRAAVYSVYRDELTSAVSSMTDVRSVEVLKRTEEGPRVELLNLWRGGGKIPAPIRHLVSEDMLCWHDYAVWDERTHTCSFRTETLYLKDAVSCEGTTSFIALDGARTRMETRGELHIDLGKVKGVPQFVAPSLSRAVERMIVRTVSASVLGVADALGKYIASLGGAPLHAQP